MSVSILGCVLPRSPCELLKVNPTQTGKLLLERSPPCSKSQKYVFFASNSFQKYIFVLKGNVYNIQLMLKYHAVGKYENFKGLDETIQSCNLCICLTFPQCVFTNVSSNRQLEIMNSNINCICLVFLHCAFPNVYSKSLGQHRQSHTVCTFSCVLSDSPQNAVMWGCKITQGCLTASPSPTRRGQPSPERCAPPSPSTYTSSSLCHSSLAMYMGRL